MFKFFVVLTAGFIIKVIASQSVFQQKPVDIFAKINSSAVLTCVTSSSSIGPLWEFGPSQIAIYQQKALTTQFAGIYMVPGNEIITNSVNYSLTIYNASFQTAGIYTCTLSDGSGQSASAVLYAIDYCQAKITNNSFNNFTLEMGLSIDFKIYGLQPNSHVFVYSISLNGDSNKTITIERNSYGSNYSAKFSHPCKFESFSGNFQAYLKITSSPNVKVINCTNILFEVINCSNVRLKDQNNESSFLYRKQIPIVSILLIIPFKINNTF